MISESLIRKLAEEKTSGSSVFILDVTIRKGNRILVTIDGDKGVTIDDCVAISRFIENHLDRDQEDFELQVSSGGADQPLRFARQYSQHTGRTLLVRKVDGTEITGILTVVTPENIELNINPIKGKNKKNSNEEAVTQLIPFAEIKESQIIITF